MPELAETKQRLVSNGFSLLAIPVATLANFLPELFILTLVVFLFRPPDVSFHEIDRIAFLVLLASAFARAVVLKRSLLPTSWIFWPMAALTLMAIISAVLQPYDVQTWSLLAAKFAVPYTCFFLGGFAFDSSGSLRRLQSFLIIVLAYLVFTALMQFLGINELVFPKFILDPDRGIHFDRARGPFLQAVANGVTLNVLGIIALNAFLTRTGRRFAAAILLLLLPFAVLATMTRAVWISFAGLVLWAAWRCRGGLQKACIAFLILATLGIFGSLLLLERNPFSERAQEEGPVEIRMAIYGAGLEMFMEKPLFGWGLNEMPGEVVRRLERYKLSSYWAHNTYLEILVEHGIAGLTLFTLVLWGLWKAGSPSPRPDSLAGLRRLWPLLMGVYLVNACFVVMNYQFVNALLFTLGGILDANRRFEHA